uniref:Venom pacifastin 1 n=1 Tax=Ectomocoris sp. TaxID=3104572 RepID=A0AB38ZE98_9HEMI
MKAALILLCVFVFVAVEACKDGDRLLVADGCNKCRCVNGTPACTKMFCPPGIKFKCNPGEMFIAKDGCSECICSAKGKHACSRKGCPGGRPKRAAGCTPGQVWKESCNDCFCADSAVPICTQKLCL